MNTKLTLLLEAVNRVTAPIKKAIASTEKLSTSVRQQQLELNKIGRLRKDLQHYRNLTTQTGKTSEALDTARAKTSQLGKELSNTKQPTTKLTNAFESARREVQRLKTRQQQEQQQLSKLRQRLEQAELSTKNLSLAELQLRKRTQQANESIDRQQQRLKKLQATQERVAKAQGKMQRRMQTAAHMSLVGQGAYGVSTRIQSGMVNLFDPLREVERSKGELETLGIDNIESIIETGRKMQGKLAGITAASFVSAAYDIKSGIATLTDDGVAAMTASAVTVAKATKAMPEQMTSLFATGYGIFKRQFGELNDAQFGEFFGASLSAAVKQFKTDGSKMQQAIESAGAFATNLGLDMREQITLLGMMQSQMQGGEAGTGLRAFTENAAKAHEQFAKLAQESGNPIIVRTLDDTGMLRSIPDILADLKKRYGDTLSGHELKEIKEAFGRTEAAKLINVLWGQEEAIRANVLALSDAARQGQSFSEKMAQLANRNLDARFELIAQKLDLAKQRIAEKLIPVIDKLLPKIEAAIEFVTQWAERHPKLVAAIGSVVIAIGSIATVIAPLLMMLSTLIGSWGMFSYTLTKVGIGAGSASGTLSKFGTVLSWLGRVIMPLLTTGLRSLAIAFVSNPIGLIITAVIAAIALVAALIYKYWQPLKAFFIGVWDGLRSAIEPVIQSLKPLIKLLAPVGHLIRWIAEGVSEAVSWFFNLFTPVEMAAEELESFKTTGQKVGEVIGKVFAAILKPITLVADAVGWLGETWNSLFNEEPSASVELSKNISHKVNQMVDPAKQTAAAAVVSTAMNMTPVAATPLQASPTMIENKPNYHIQLHATASMDEQQLITRLKEELDRRDREHAARIRAQLHD